MLKSQHYLRVSPTDVGLNRGTDCCGAGLPSVSPTDVGLNRDDELGNEIVSDCITHGRGFESCG